VFALKFYPYKNCFTYIPVLRCACLIFLFFLIGKSSSARNDSLQTKHFYISVQTGLLVPLGEFRANSESSNLAIFGLTAGIEAGYIFLNNIRVGLVAQNSTFATDILKGREYYSEFLDKMLDARVNRLFSYNCSNLSAMVGYKFKNNITVSALGGVGRFSRKPEDFNVIDGKLIRTSIAVSEGKSTGFVKGFRADYDYRIPRLPIAFGISSEVLHANYTLNDSITINDFYTGQSQQKLNTNINYFTVSFLLKIAVLL